VKACESTDAFSCLIGILTLGIGVDLGVISPAYSGIHSAVPGPFTVNQSHALRC